MADEEGTVVEDEVVEGSEVAGEEPVAAQDAKTGEEHIEV